jgi:RsiW-degrading membrane proteinase PrsW (M82 family)
MELETMKKGKVSIELHKPDASEMVFFFLCGVIISVPLTLFIYQYTDVLLAGLDTFTIALVSRVFFAPFIEEFAKAYPLFYRHGETQLSMLNLAVLVGLGFGIVELLTYVSLDVPIGYRLPGIFFHPASTALTAYGITIKRPIPFYLLAVFFHFANNYLALVLTDPLPLLGSILVVSLTVFTFWKLRNRADEKIIV